MTDEIIVLLKDGSTCVIPKDKLKGNLEKVIPEKFVYSILIPVGIYSPQYIMFKPKDLIDGFISATISYQLVIYQVGPMALVSDELDPIEPVNISCKCLSDLYMSLHSLCKIDGFNMVYSSVDQSTSINNKTPLLRVNNLKLSIKTDAGTSTFDLGHSKHQKRKIDKFFSKNFSVESCLPDYVYGTRIFIDIENCLWQIRGNDHKGRCIAGSQQISPGDCNPDTCPDNILQSAGLIRYNCMTFINPKDAQLLSKYGGTIHITEFNQMEMLDNITDLIDSGSPLEYTQIIEHPEYFSVISDSVYQLFTSSDIIEAVMTLRHTLTTWQVVNKILNANKGASIFDESSVMISIRLLKSKSRNYEEDPVYDAKHTFNYSASIVENEDYYIEDYYDDFMTELRKFEETID